MREVFSIVRGEEGRKGVMLQKIENQILKNSALAASNFSTPTGRNHHLTRISYGTIIAKSQDILEICAGNFMASHNKGNKLI